MPWIDRANIRFVSDGTMPGTKICLIDKEGNEHEITPVTEAQARIGFENGEPILHMTVALAQLDLVMPQELVEFVVEPRFTIVDKTPWYVNLWLKLKNVSNNSGGQKSNEKLEMSDGEGAEG